MARLGSQRVGLAISDPLASQLRACPRCRGAISSRTELPEVLPASTVSLLLPRNPAANDGQAGTQAEKVRLFAETSGASQHRSSLVDERLTSAEALRTLRDADGAGKTRTLRRSYGSVLLLQNFLDSQPRPSAVRGRKRMRDSDSRFSPPYRSPS